jgi:hypothetical protein
VQLNVEPPPTNVLAVAAVMEIVPVPVPAVVVKLAGKPLLNAIMLAFEQTIIPALNVKFFVPNPLANLFVAVQVLPFKSNVPFVSVIIVAVKALPNAQLPPTPLNVTAEPKPIPFVVTVLPVVVELNVVVPVYVRVKFVAGKVKLPDTFKLIFDPAKVITPSRPDAKKSLQTVGEFAIVTVNAVANTFEFASKNTLSDAVGTDAPPAPPDDVDQLVVLVESQVPVPPTQ